MDQIPAQARAAWPGLVALRISDYGIGAGLWGPGPPGRPTTRRCGRPGPGGLRPAEVAAAAAQTGNSQAGRGRRPQQAATCQCVAGIAAAADAVNGVTGDGGDCEAEMLSVTTMMMVAVATVTPTVVERT